MITNKDKCIFINDNSDYWVYTPEQALIELSAELAGVEKRINKYGADDLYMELDLAEAIKEAISDPDKYVGVGKEYGEYWEAITQDGLDFLYKECKENE